MLKLTIEHKTNTPSVVFNPDSGVLLIHGRSIPEHPEKFFQPIIEWLERYLSTNPTSVLFKIHLDYLNTHSTECMVILFKKVEQYYNQGHEDVKIQWMYDEDDEDMVNMGEDFQSIINCPFEILEVKE